MHKMLKKWLTPLLTIVLLVWIMPWYALADSQVTQPQVSVYSNHIKKTAAYEVVFNTGNTVSSYLSGSEGDTISINFPAGTILPASISNSNIMINGETVNQGSIIINKSGGNNLLTIPVPSNLVIPANSFVEVEISKNAGIVNPSTAGGNYFLQVWTSNDITPVNSAYYAIFDSVITVPEVTVSPNIIGKAGAYFIKFRTSSEGNLVQNSDSIYIIFPKDTTVPLSVNRSNILVNGVALASNPVITNDPLVTKDPEQRYLMELRVPINIAAGQEVNIQIKPEANVLHPTSQGFYDLTLWTSQDLVKNVSTKYEVADAITGLTVWVSPDIAGQTGQYIVAVENGSKTLNIGDRITIKFPVGTELSKTNIAGNVFLDGVAFQGTTTVNQTERTITLTLTSQIAPNKITNILLTQGAGITNPQKLGNYTLQAKTSQDIAFQTSNVYTISGNHIVNLSTQVGDNAIGINGNYLIQFTTSSSGGLLGGLDTVTILFPSDTVLPSSINSSTIQINDKQLDKNVVVSQANRSIKLTVPTGVNISQNGNVKINILTSAGIKNPSKVGSYRLTAFTSKDPVAVESLDYIIGKQISSPTVSVSPNKYLEAGQYSIGFYASNQGGLSYSDNDYITVTFPTGTRVPSSIAAANVLVNGNPASSVKVTQQTVKIYLPANMNISQSGYIGIVFNSNANIVNPVGGTYRLTVSTSKDTSSVISQNYTTVGTAPTTSNPGTQPPPSSSYNNDLEIELSSYAANSLTEYTIKYKTGNSGALTAGEDEITIEFDSKVQMPDYISRETVTVNDLPVNIGWVRIDRNEITFNIPSTLKVNNNQWITIEIAEDAEIRNPSKEGIYDIAVSTTKDTRAVELDYEIEGDADASLDVEVDYTSSGRIIEYELVYESDESLKGGYDWVAIWLPNAIYKEQITNNLSISVNGYDVDEDLIITSGKSISFLLPSGVSVRSNRDLKITIDDPNSIIAPNIAGEFVLYLSTSKNPTQIASNKIKSFKKSETTNDTEYPSNDNNSGQYPTPTVPKNNISVKLTLNKTEATVNGSKKTLSAAPKVINGTTMVPLRFITEELGGTVDYRAEEKRIIILYNEQYMILTLNSKEVYTSNSVLNLNVAPTVVNGSTLVPLRTISEWMGIYTYYDNKDKTILLSK